MLRIGLELHQITEWSSTGVKMQELIRRDGPRLQDPHCPLGPASVLGRHTGRLWQLLTVLSGSGWVSGQDQVRHPCVAGDAFGWAPGESHESGSDLGITVVIVQSDQPFHP